MFLLFRFFFFPSSNKTPPPLPPKRYSNTAWSTDKPLKDRQISVTIQPIPILKIETDTTDTSLLQILFISCSHTVLHVLQSPFGPFFMSSVLISFIFDSRITSHEYYYIIFSLPKTYFFHLFLSHPSFAITCLFSYHLSFFLLCSSSFLPSLTSFP